MNRTVEMESVSPMRARPQETLAPSRSDRGQGEAFRSSLKSAEAESPAANEAPAKAPPEDDGEPLPYMVAWAPPPADTETAAAADPDLTEDIGAEIAIPDAAASEAAETMADEASAVPAPAVAEQDETLEPELASVDTDQQRSTSERDKTAPDTATRSAAANPADPDLKTAASTLDLPAPSSDAMASLTPDMPDGEQASDSAGEPRAFMAEVGQSGRAERDPDILPDDLPAPEPDNTIRLAQAPDTAARTDSQAQSTQSLVSGASAPAAATPAPAATPAAPTTFTPAPGQPIITASPAELVSVVTDNLSTGEDKQDRIVVQLDPPELGRVSIDFKIDAQGVQHITVTGETPEALRQLRAMHFELIQSLERQGISAGDMTFRQEQQSGGQQNPQAGSASNATSDPGTAAPASTVRLASPPPRNIQPPGAAGGLNIRL